MKLVNVSIKIDEFADYIPVVSTVTNLINFFQKGIQPLIRESNFCKNHYYTYIQQKSVLRCIMLLVPILGNIVIGVFDSLLDYKKSGSLSLMIAPYRVKNDREIVLAAVKVENRNWVLKYASDALKNDKEVVMAAVKKDGRALKYASDALKNDKEVVMAAVKKDGRALKYASDALKNDKEWLFKQ